MKTEPGTIADPVAYAAALERGEITEIPQPDPGVMLAELARSLVEVGAVLADLCDRQEAVEQVLLEMAGQVRIGAAEAFRARVKARRRRA